MESESTVAPAEEGGVAFTVVTKQQSLTPSRLSNVRNIKRNQHRRDLKAWRQKKGEQ
ncbi:hypothetical protein J6590_057296 [Homalodisca vitripennis]|nr:hypothetical protein J6590_057296 [Homalodisca vitripennis]